MKSLTSLFVLSSAFLACAKPTSDSKHKRGLLFVTAAGVTPYSDGGAFGASSISSGLGYASSFGYSSSLIPSASTSTLITISRTVPVPVLHPVPFTVIRAVPVAQPYPVQVSKPDPVPVPQPVAVVVPKPYPVPVHKPYPITVPRIVPISVPLPVPVPVPSPYPVASPYPIPVSQPYAVPVPVATPVGESSTTGTVGVGSSSAQLSENFVGAPSGAVSGAPYGVLTTAPLRNLVIPSRGVEHVYAGSRAGAHLSNKLPYKSFADC